jgi:hypothetical protein
MKLDQVAVFPRKQINPIDRSASVKLSLSQWNSILCFLHDARSHNLANNYPSTAADIARLMDIIRSQVDGKIDAAFAKQFPDTFPRDSVAV